MAPARARVARLLAVMLVLTLVGPAFAECVGGSTSAGRHACCAGRLEAATTASVPDCCTMSAPSDEGVPAENIAAPQPLHVDRPLVSVELVPSRITVPTVTTSSRRATHVPLYLQQAAFLI